MGFKTSRTSIVPRRCYGIWTKASRRALAREDPPGRIPNRKDFLVAEPRVSVHRVSFSFFFSPVSFFFPQHRSPTILSTSGYTSGSVQPVENARTRAKSTRESSLTRRNLTRPRFSEPLWRECGAKESSHMWDAQIRDVDDECIATREARTRSLARSRCIDRCARRLGGGKILRVKRKENHWKKKNKRKSSGTSRVRMRRVR